ncbi:MAG: Smr/MutS family protein [Deltaproteobacteria bacterium]|nr:Smr/MutS family protein [Deltaproteobacteria bacterium]
MAKKSRQNPPKPKEFHSVPFGSLKNLVVPDEIKVKPSAPPARKPVEPAENSLDLFLREVADVRPIHGQDAKQATNSPHHLGKNAAEAQRASSPVTELADNLFLQEIGRLKLDTKFSDSVPDDGELEPLSGNRLRQVKRGVVSVEHQLDLHGLRRDEALAALPRFLQSARNRGQKAVLIITGKGNHSAEEPVLQQAVASWLREAGRELVLEFAPAPRELGGSGALVVFLRPVRLSG